MINTDIESKLYNHPNENDGETDNYVTCPLLQIKYCKPRKPITSRLGQKIRSLKYSNGNLPLFENKTAEANLGSSFQICTPEIIFNDLKHDTLNTPPVVSAKNDICIETPSDTFTNLNRNTVRNLNLRPTLPLSTKWSVYNKENVPEQKSSESKFIFTSGSINTTPFSLTVKKKVEEIEKSKSPVYEKDNTYYASPEISMYNYDSTLYHSVRETTNIPEYSSFSITNFNCSSSTKQLDYQPKHSPLELITTTKYKNVTVHNPSATHPTPIEFFQEELKQSMNLLDSMCIKCASENFITVKGINYNILNTLGYGGSSIVYEVLHPETNHVVAIKKVDLSEVEDIIAKGYLNEVNVLQNLQDCESVIHLFDSEYMYKEKKLYMVMEKGDTDLSKLIRSTKNMSIHMIIYYWSEMLTAVNEIHTRGVIHSDLKPANFLLVSGRLKLIDFGIASKIQGDMTSVLKDVTSGTWNYMSPECIRSGGSNFKGHKINQKSDVWSLGCILYSLIYSKTPYSHLTNTWQKLQAIAESKQNITFPSHSKIFTQGIPSILMQTLELCLMKDVKARPYVIDLLKLIENTVFKPMIK